jgi:outer membrane protein assembly factor BamB
MKEKKMKLNIIGMLTVVAVFLLVGGKPVAQGSESSSVPLGHPDFYPSHERPIGWRGDGSGAWPGAKCVTSWDAETGQNIAWKAPMPGAGFAQPIVAGEKVFTTADPNLLVCLDVHTGKILWQTAIDHTQAMPPEMAAKAREEIAFFDANWLEYHQWRLDIEKLTGLLKDQTAFWDSKKGLFLPPDEKVAPEAEVRQLWQAILDRHKENGWEYGGGSGNETLTGKSPLYKRWEDANRLYDVWFGGRYDGLITWSFATPCTDGERVYVTTVNNAVAAVNFDGKIEWLIWESRATGETKEYGGSIGRKDGPMGTRYVPSPVLYGNYLVVHQNNEMRVYDKRTGKKIWGDVNTLERLKMGTQGPARQWPEGTSPVVVAAPLLDGSKLPVIFDGCYFFYRLEDGKILSTNGYYGACSTPAVAGNILAKNCESSFVLRLTAKDRDTLDLEVIFAAPHGKKGSKEKPAVTMPGGQTSIIHDGWWYGTFKKSGMIRLALKDGSIETPSRGLYGGNCSPILAGTRIYQFAQGMAFKEKSATPHKDVDGVIEASFVDLNTMKGPTIKNGAIDRRMCEDAEFAKRTLFARMAWDISTSSPGAQANRLFYRTKGWLYCIGDPKEPFPVPKECPPQGRLGK